MKNQLNNTSYFNMRKSNKTGCFPVPMNAYLDKYARLTCFIVTLACAVEQMNRIVLQLSDIFHFYFCPSHAMAFEIPFIIRY